MRIKAVEVALEAKSGGAESIYTYELGIAAQAGDALLVPLGSRTVMGFALRVYDVDDGELDFALRPVSSRVDGLNLPPPLLALVRFTADQTMSPLPVALGPAMPPGVRTRLSELWRVNPDVVPSNLTRSQREVLAALEQAGGEMSDAKVKSLKPPLRNGLKALRTKGVVIQSLTLPAIKAPLSTDLYRLTPDSTSVDSFLHEHGRKRPAQALTLLRMQAADGAALSSAEIRALSGVSDAIVKELAKAGLLEAVKADAQISAAPPTPNPEQQSAIDHLSQAISRREPAVHLLFGITGSGKTEVYLRAAAEALQAGRQVLYLVPEIALAAQVIAQLRQRFGDRVAVIHSGLTPTERLANWMQIRRGEAPIVLGARSALFAPLANLGLIIVDEEHDNAYKQDNSPRYYAKPLIKFLAHQHSCPVVVGSATPSIESYHEAESATDPNHRTPTELQPNLTEQHRTTPLITDHRRLLTLTKRTADAKLPTVEIEDLGAGYRKGHPAILGPLLKSRLIDTLARREQAILFLNRRAYSPMLMCRECGQLFTCPKCSVNLSYSRKDRMLRCHHCEHREKPPDECPKCGGNRLNPFGVGTEKVEEAIRTDYPACRVGRLDRDVVQQKGALEGILAAFRSGEIDVLVGTQMVAKGLDFPRVTLVGVIAADVGLGLPDFRASERTFQLLSQVAGRAGRGELPGHVVIQTFNPLHQSVTCAQNHDYLGFYRNTLLERRQANYPPFCRLINIVISGESYPAVNHGSFELAVALEGLESVEILGPVDAPIERLQGRWRRHILLKIPPDLPLGPIRKRLEGYRPTKLQVTIDVDPFSLG